MLNISLGMWCAYVARARTQRSENHSLLLVNVFHSNLSIQRMLPLSYRVLGLFTFSRVTLVQPVGKTRRVGEE